MVMVSLRNKRLQLNYCAKLGNSKKKKKARRGSGRGEDLPFLPSPSLFIRIFLRPNVLNEIAQERLLRQASLVMVRFEKYFTKFPDNTILAS